MIERASLIGLQLLGSLRSSFGNLGAAAGWCAVMLGLTTGLWLPGVWAQGSPVQASQAIQNLSSQGSGSSSGGGAGAFLAPEVSTAPSATPSTSTAPSALFSRFLGPLAPISSPEPSGGLPPAAAVHPSAPLARPQVFGSNMFNGRFKAEQFTGFNPEYQMHVGDQIALRMWGAFTFESTVTVDPQGNIFIPNVGPVHVLGVRNAELNRHVEANVRRVYRANVGVYASTTAAQQVKVYVTGFVVQPGLYAGLSSDSVLYFLDAAGGIDLARGSFHDVRVLRGGRVRGAFDLYDFLLDGRIDALQLVDGDTIVVGQRKYSISVSGEVMNPFQFELIRPEINASSLLTVARPKPSATHLSIVRKEGPKLRSEYHAIANIGNVVIQDGDEVNFTSDKYPGTILVRIEGANLGQHALVLPYGARLRDAFAKTKPAAQANAAAVQLFRRSVAVRQKEMLDKSLQTLQAMVLTPRSSTQEESVLREKDAQLALQYIARAKDIQPIGQIVLGPKQDVPNVLLEDGDIIRIPEATNLVMVHGEVVFPTALVFAANTSVDDYVEQAGGYTQNADNSRIVVVHQDGTFSEGDGSDIRAGDEIMVLPKVDTKNWEFARTIAQILFYLGVAARVVL